MLVSLFEKGQHCHKQTSRGYNQSQDSNENHNDLRVRHAPHLPSYVIKTSLLGRLPPLLWVPYKNLTYPCQVFKTHNRLFIKVLGNCSEPSELCLIFLCKTEKIFCPVSQHKVDNPFLFPVAMSVLWIAP